MMKREFTVTGLCVPEEHYMVDISNKVAQIKKLIDKRFYFTINRARQFGKTTMLHALETHLGNEYTVISLTLEGLGIESFESPRKFCQKFTQHISKALKFTNVREEYRESWKNPSIVDFDTLSDHITELSKEKKIVLLIDEVDKVTNNQVFMDFLSMLRKKYLARTKRKDFTFHSVILAGVYDIKNLKWKIKERGDAHLKNEERVNNSPWNIAVNFTVDMSFNPEEIETMLIAYESDHKTGMNTLNIAEEIYKYTSGYPFLVSRICQCIHEELGKEWSAAGVQEAVKNILSEKSTLLEDMFKNLKTNKDFSVMIRRIILDGEKFPFSGGVAEVDLGLQYGYIAKKNNHIVISNKIFENAMLEYFLKTGFKLR